MQLHELKPTVRKAKAKRIGRGGKRGKTSGRGHKGQAARAGNSTRPEMREIIKKLPKLRGHGINRAKTVNSGRIKPFPVNLSTLAENFEAGAEVNPKSLVAAGVINANKGKTLKVKILATGTIDKKVSVSNCTISAAAKAKIEAAGGKVL